MRVSRMRSLLLIFWGKTPPRVPGWRGPPRRWWVRRSAWAACRGRESCGEVVQFVAAHSGQGRVGQGLDDRGPGGAGPLVEEGEQVAGGAETDRRDPGVVAVVLEEFSS